jgi:hypothetical protein
VRAKGGTDGGARVESATLAFRMDGTPGAARVEITRAGP